MATLETAGDVPGLLDSWAPEGSTLGAYVHVPFCTKRCGYCSFNTSPYRRDAADRFLQALAREVQRVGVASWAASVTLSTVFLGGGTPSLLEVSELSAALARLRGAFSIANDVEITVECNPDSVSRERLAGYRRAGVNRISLGVQSLDDRILHTLDRLHTASRARAAFDAAREAGFGNVSVDLIYGLPGLDLSTWERSIRDVLAWKPDHLSAYGLTLDEGSLWHALGVTGLPPEETVTAQYWTLARAAREAGYEHYEISNYARPGRRAAHNQIYWRAEEYLGLGPGACGFLGSVRYQNVKPIDRYGALLEEGRWPLGFHETLTRRQRLAERLMLGLRQSDGVPQGWIQERLALEPGRLPGLLRSWGERGLLCVEGERVRLTEAGFLLSDALFAELL